MASPNITKNLRDGIITIKDGAGSPNTLEIILDTGDLNFTVAQEHIVVLDRGKLDHMRPGDEVAVAFTFSAKFVEWSGRTGSAGDVSVKDALKKEGNAAGWESTTDCDVYSVDLEFKIQNPCPGNESETLVFADAVCDNVVFAEGDEFNTLSFTGKALITSPASSYAA